MLVSYLSILKIVRRSHSWLVKLQTKISVFLIARFYLFLEHIICISYQPTITMTNFNETLLVQKATTKEVLEQIAKNAMLDLSNKSDTGVASLNLQP